jgi:hypothetical protein
MTNSPILDIPLLDPNAAQPEVVVNAAIVAGETAARARVLVGVTSSNTVTLTQDQVAQGSMFVLDVTSPGPSAGFTVNFPAITQGIFTAENQAEFLDTPMLNVVCSDCRRLR